MCSADCLRCLLSTFCFEDAGIMFTVVTTGALFLLLLSVFLFLSFLSFFLFSNSTFIHKICGVASPPLKRA